MHFIVYISLFIVCSFYIVFVYDLISIYELSICIGTSIEYHSTFYDLQDLLFNITRTSTPGKETDLYIVNVTIQGERIVFLGSNKLCLSGIYQYRANKMVLLFSGDNENGSDLDPSMENKDSQKVFKLFFIKNY